MARTERQNIFYKKAFTSFLMAKYSLIGNFYYLLKPLLVVKWSEQFKLLTKIYNLV